MRRAEDIRQALIDNTIHVIAAGGFEYATTRNIAKYPSPLFAGTLNDAYIYRVFGSKEGLYDEVFATLDAELTAAFCSRLRSLDRSDKSAKEILLYIFEGVWRFVLRDEDRCRCYVRYYYSIYFKEASQRKHRESFNQIVKGLLPLFKPEADATAILHSAFTAILDFAIRVYNGDLENTENNTKHIFNVLYSIIAPYLKET
ncbi:MAG: TetR/AcrR family transcriptional regulator [Clostridia bacterium]|nr:TetR/AcrR family transcriptional regulator [Clostridia bacterium]